MLLYSQKQTFECLLKDQHNVYLEIYAFNYCLGSFRNCLFEWITRMYIIKWMCCVWLLFSKIILVFNVITHTPTHTLSHTHTHLCIYNIRWFLYFLYVSTNIQVGFYTTHTHTHLYSHTYTHTSTHTKLYICYIVLVLVYIHIYMYTHICRCVYIYMCVYMCVCVCLLVSK